MLIRRLIQLHLGLCLFGFALALMVRATLGLDPWTVVQQGLMGVTGLTLGQLSIAVGALVMLAWIPLRQKPGYGTLANIVVIGLVIVAAVLAVLYALILDVVIYREITGKDLGRMLVQTGITTAAVSLLAGVGLGGARGALGAVRP